MRMMIWPSSTVTSPSPPKSVTFQPASVLPSKSDCQPPAAACGSSARKEKQIANVNVVHKTAKQRTRMVILHSFALLNSAVCNLPYLRPPEPLHVLVNAGFNGDGRLVPEQAAGFGQAGVGERHVFGSRRMMFDHSFGAGRSFDELNQLPNGNRLIVAEVDALTDNVGGS